MATLRISLTQVRTILISPSPDTSQTCWTNVQAFWAPTRIRLHVVEPIEVSIHEFASKKLWLRTHWVSDGNKVDVDVDVAPALQIEELKVREFQRRAGTNSDCPHVDLSEFHFKRKLTSFQNHNVAHLASMPHGADFSVPGAGKTATSLVVWELLKSNKSVESLLIICPKSSVESWLNESQSVLAHPPNIYVFDGQPIETSADVLIVNFERLDNHDTVGRITQWMSLRKCQLVIDEAHRIKSGPKSVRWNACNTIRQSAVRVDLLTGTPMTQSIDDLRHLYSLSWNLPTNSITNETLECMSRGSVFVRTTKSELGLPPVKIHSIDVPMSTIQTEIYKALRSKVSEMFALSRSDEAYFGQRGKAVMTLLSVASNPGLLLHRTNEDAYRFFEWPPRIVTVEDQLIKVLDNYAKYEIPTKYKWVINFMNDLKNSGKKVIIWSSFVGNLLSLGHLLSPLKPAIIFGSTDDDQRKQELARFRLSSDCRILLTNPQTLGEGISLHQTCHDAIYLDRTYNAGQYLQSIDRIHRLGLPQNTETNVYLLQSTNSIDEHVNNRLNDKIHRLAQMMDDPKLVLSSLPNFCDFDEVDHSVYDNDDFTDLLHHLSTEPL